MLSALAPRHLFRTAVDLELQGARALESAADSADAWLHWAEHVNRLHVFNLFQYADVALGAARDAALPDLLDRTRDFSPYDRVWVTEGAGYLWGGRLTGPLPETSLIPLHSGVGLSIARQVLQDHRARGRRDVVAAIVEQCADCAMPAFERVAIETIGLAVRTLHPQLARHFDDVLSACDPVLHACFWHGMGRGAYFAASNWRIAAAPGADAIASLASLAGGARARMNAISGFMWAVTLVNLPTPEVLMRYLGRVADEAEAAAFRDGVTASLIVWQHAAPDDAGIEALLACEPLGPTTRSWDALVRGPAEAALARYPAVRAGGHLQDVFVCEAQ